MHCAILVLTIRYPIFFEKVLSIKKNEYMTAKSTVKYIKLLYHSRYLCIYLLIIWDSFFLSGCY